MFRKLAAIILGCAALAGCGSRPGGAVTASYSGVQGLFNERCVRCHGARPKDGVDLRTFDSVMRGGKDGPIVVAGNASSSVLAQVLRGANGKKQMPMRQAPLSEEQIKAVESWITAGAKGP